MPDVNAVKRENQKEGVIAIFTRKFDDGKFFEGEPVWVSNIEADSSKIKMDFEIDNVNLGGPNAAIMNPKDLDRINAGEGDRLRLTNAKQQLPVLTDFQVEYSTKVTDVAYKKKKIIILVDTSRSMTGEPMFYTKEALWAFMEMTYFSGSEDELGLIEFPSEPGKNSAKVVFEPTNEYDIHWSEIDRLTANGRTPMVEALEEAKKEFEKTSDEDILNFIFLLTDGRPYPFDKKQREKLETIIDTFKRKKIRIVAAGIGGDCDKTLMTKLALSTKGKYIDINLNRLWKIQDVFEEFFKKANLGADRAK